MWLRIRSPGGGTKDSNCRNFVSYRRIATIFIPPWSRRRWPFTGEVKTRVQMTCYNVRQMAAPKYSVVRKFVVYRAIDMILIPNWPGRRTLLPGDVESRIFRLEDDKPQPFLFSHVWVIHDTKLLLLSLAISRSYPQAYSWTYVLHDGDNFGTTTGVTSALPKLAI